MLDISISIVNFNNKSLLKECLDSIYRTLPLTIHYEIIIVDNNSSDGSPEMIKKDYPHAILITNTQNKGYSSAVNQAIKKSNGKYIALLNDDMYVLPNALAYMKHFLDSNTKVGAVCCKILNPDKTLQIHDTTRFPAPITKLLINIISTRLLGNNKFKTDPSIFNNKHEVDYVTGAASMIRRQVFEDVGLFDEQFFMFAEETELGTRIKKQGWKAYYIPNAHIIHYGGASSRKNPDPAVAAKYELICLNHLFLFYRKYYGWHSMAALKILQLIKNTIGLIKLKKVYVLSKQNKQGIQIQIDSTKNTINAIVHNRCNLDRKVPRL